jgi:hypothetical protein
MSNYERFNIYAQTDTIVGSELCSKPILSATRVDTGDLTSANLQNSCDEVQSDKPYTYQCYNRVIIPWCITVIYSAVGCVHHFV